jgi:hypothetical protein
LAWIRSTNAKECSGPIALSAAVERKLGRAAFTTPARADLAIEGRIERVGPEGPWASTIAIVDEAGNVVGLRELRSEARDCHAFDDELALVIALLIDPGALFGPAHPAVAPITPAPAIPAFVPLWPIAMAPPMAPPAPLSPPCPRPITPHPAPWRFNASAGVLGGIGLLPAPSLGVAIRLQATPPGWPALELGGSSWLSQRTGTDAVGATFSMNWASLLVCPVGIEAERNSARLCLGAAAGALQAESFGLTAPSRKELLELNLEASLAYQRRLFGPLTARLGVTLLVPTVRGRFSYVTAASAERDLFQQAPVVGALEMAVGVALP